MINRLILFILISFTTLNAQLTLNDSTQKYDNFKIQYLYDEESSLNIQDIQNKTFTQTIPSQFTKGYKDGTAWFKIEINNKSKNKDFILYFTESIWSQVDLYTKDNNKWNIDKNGLNTPLNERSIKDSSPAFKLQIESNAHAIYYVKGQTIASQIGEFQVYTKDEYYSPSRLSIVDYYIIYSFILFSFILLNLYNLFATKEKIYAYYISYVFIYILFAFMQSGIYIRLGFPNWQEGLHVLGVLTLFALLQFSIEFLSLKTTYQRMEKAFNCLSIISIIFAFLLFNNVPYATFMSNVFFSGALIIIVATAIKILKNGFDGAKYYLFALMTYLPAMAMMAMNFNTILPNTDITRYAFLVGAFIEIFLFTVILTNRYMDINKLNNLLTIKTTELEEIKAQLTIEATTDMLSGLYNRRYFFEASQKSFYTAHRYNKPLSIIMIDLDKFKSINDNFGHNFGDKVIRVFSNFLRTLIRNSDIAARYGGEEFIILLPDTNISDAQILAERIREGISQKEVCSDDKNCTRVTVSIGITELNSDNDIDIEQIIERSDKALYMAKENGRNRVVKL